MQLSDCIAARAKGGGRTVWRHNAQKQLVNGWSGLCLQMNLASDYTQFNNANCYAGHGAGREIDRHGVVTGSLAKCEARCDADAECVPSDALGRVLIRSLEIARQGQQLYLEQPPTFRPQNPRKDTVDVYWQENVGKEVWMAAMAPGGHYFTHTWTGSVFIVRARDGQTPASKTRKGGNTAGAKKATADGTILLVKTIPDNKDLVVNV